MRIIAEIGLNHNGSLDRGLNLVNDLVKTSVDGITFQIRESSFYDRSHPRKHELPISFYREAIQLIHSHDKLAGFALSQIENVDLYNSLSIDFWKSLSWELYNTELLDKLSDTGKIIYVSTGVSNLDEIVDVSNRYENIEFLHTSLDYALENVNLRAIESMRSAAGKPVGFGLHSQFHDVLFASVGFQPSAIFFYVKDNTDGEHPDDEHAISIVDTEKYVSRLKKLSICVGNGEKRKIVNTLHPTDDDICK